MLDWRLKTLAHTNFKWKNIINYKSRPGRKVFLSSMHTNICTCTYNTCARNTLGQRTMCTFARLKHLLMIRRRGSQCCVTLVGMLLAVSILKIAYHSKFSEGMAENSLILKMIWNPVSLVWLDPRVFITQCCPTHNVNWHFKEKNCINEMSIFISTSLTVFYMYTWSSQHWGHIIPIAWLWAKIKDILNLSHLIPHLIC